MIKEIGPFTVATDSMDIELNEYAWNKNISLLFLESPPYVGFSIQKSEGI